MAMTTEAFKPYTDKPTQAELERRQREFVDSLLNFPAGHTAIAVRMAMEKGFSRDDGTPIRISESEVAVWMGTIFAYAFSGPEKPIENLNFPQMANDTGISERILKASSEAMVAANILTSTAIKQRNKQGNKTPILI